jgi:hypothetical protein
MFGSTRPRKQHYGYVHKGLPAWFFANPKKMIESLIYNGADFLRTMWDDIGLLMLKMDGSIPTEATGLEVHLDALQIVPRTSIVVIALPAPQYPLEAYFVGLIHRPAKRKWFGLFGETPSFSRYITLEYGLDQNQRPTAFLCEWNKETHSNYGEGPEPTLSAFIKTLVLMSDEGDRLQSA